MQVETLATTSACAHPTGFWCNAYLKIVSSVCLFAAATPAFGADQNERPARVEIGGPFELLGTGGETVSNTTYLGKWLLVSFGYTFCPDICPMTMALQSDVLDEIGNDAGLLQPLFISVDPARDTPEIVRGFVEAFDPRIVGLTGTPEAIEAVAAAYGAHFKVNKDVDSDEYYTVDHSTYLYLMDPQGAFVRGLRPTDSPEDIAAIIRDAMARH
jgi:protein SCO1/2